MAAEEHRRDFHEQLDALVTDVIRLSALSTEAISTGTQALLDSDLAAVERIFERDAAIDELTHAIEERCYLLLARQQPMASDLRKIVAILHVVVDLERMGDHAEGIAKIAIMLADEPPLKPYIDIPRMAEIAIRMLRGSLEAFKQRDVDLARKVCDDDDEVDALYDQVYRELITFMINDPRTIERATHITWIAHNLERIADRVTNICERVVYMVQGRIEELNVSKY